MASTRYIDHVQLIPKDAADDAQAITFDGETASAIIDAWLNSYGEGTFTFINADGNREVDRFACYCKMIILPRTTEEVETPECELINCIGVCSQPDS